MHRRKTYVRVPDHIAYGKLTKKQLVGVKKLDSGFKMNQSKVISYSTAANSDPSAPKRIPEKRYSDGTSTRRTRQNFTVLKKALGQQNTVQEDTLSISDDSVESPNEGGNDDTVLRQLSAKRSSFTSEIQEDCDDDSSARNPASSLSLPLQDSTSRVDDASSSPSSTSSSVVEQPVGNRVQRALRSGRKFDVWRHQEGIDMASIGALVTNTVKAVRNGYLCEFNLEQSSISSWEKMPAEYVMPCTIYCFGDGRVPVNECTTCHILFHDECVAQCLRESSLKRKRLLASMQKKGKKFLCLTCCLYELEKNERNKEFRKSVEKPGFPLTSTNVNPMPEILRKRLPAASEWLTGWIWAKPPYLSNRKDTGARLPRYHLFLKHSHRLERLLHEHRKVYLVRDLLVYKLPSNFFMHDLKSGQYNISLPGSVTYEDELQRITVFASPEPGHAPAPAPAPAPARVRAPSPQLQEPLADPSSTDEESESSVEDAVAPSAARQGQSGAFGLEEREALESVDFRECVRKAPREEPRRREAVDDWRPEPLRSVTEGDHNYASRPPRRRTSATSFANRHCKRRVPAILRRTTRGPEQPPLPPPLPLPAPWRHNRCASEAILAQRRPAMPVTLPWTPPSVHVQPTITVSASVLRASASVTSVARVSASAAMLASTMASMPAPVPPLDQTGPEPRPAADRLSIPVAQPARERLAAPIRTPVGVSLSDLGMHRALDLVFAQLDAVSRLRCRLVCRDWRRIIDSSPELCGGRLVPREGHVLRLRNVVGLWWWLRSRQVAEVDLRGFQELTSEQLERLAAAMEADSEMWPTPAPLAKLRIRRCPDDLAQRMITAVPHLTLMIGAEEDDD